MTGVGTASDTGRYCCEDELRREEVRAAGGLNGIDFLEVDATQRVLTVTFLQPVQGAGAVPQDPALTAAQLRVEGGTQVTGLRVVSAVPAGRTLTVTLDRVGDFSTYRFRIAQPTAAGEVPPGFDTRLAVVPFSVKASCPSGADCGGGCTCPPPDYPEPALDYLAKDYASFRQLMLDRLAVTLPGWVERNPADVGVAVVELLAYLGDHLSYAQDAIATEAHLGTARLRTSVRRHARLLDYVVGDGVSARTFLHFTVSTGVTVPAGTAARAGAGVSAPVFETLEPVAAVAGNDEIAFHTWSDESCCLPVGATSATLSAAGGAVLQRGDLLLLEETVGVEGSAADPRHRAVVRLVDVTPDVDRLDSTPVLEVSWHELDALTFPLTVSVPGAVTAVARGNLALADHGETQPAAGLVTEAFVPPGRWRPLVPDGPLARTIPVDRGAAAALLLAPDPARARPAIVLDDGDETWLPVLDLLSSGPTDPRFVVELEDDGSSRIRFGDDELGRRPAPDTPFLATYRVGGGAPGNVGPDTVDRLGAPLSGLTGVRNVVAAVGGTDPESLERVRVVAPQAFRVQERAVTEADYGAIASRVPGVQRAASALRWTGSWYAAYVTVDRLGGRPLADGGFADTVTTALDRARMTGVDVEVVPPAPVPVELALTVYVGSGAVAGQVGSAVARRLSTGFLPDGRRAFFHPDELVLGAPLYLSRVFQAVLEVPGVDHVAATALRRQSRPDAGELAAGVLRVGPLEVVQLESDTTHPDRGRLDLALVGGL